MSNHSAQWIFSISITKSNLDIFQLFWKHWIQLNQSYNYAFQSMWNSQRVEINSSEERWWTLSDQADKVINILSLVCKVKSASFFMISESLKSSQSTRQLLSEKVLRLSASSRRSSWVQIKRKNEYKSTCQVNHHREKIECVLRVSTIENKRCMQKFNVQDLIKCFNDV